jgi:hypothetical protein
VDPVDPHTVSVFTVPDGSGQPLSSARLLGGTVVDATIRLRLETEEGEPIVGFPAEEIWLETTEGGLVTCLHGAIADAPTDDDGWTSFSHAVFGGGASDPALGEVTAVAVNCVHYHPGRTILFNSPDLSGDLVVNLADAVLFAGALYGEYRYAADLYWDGQIDLVDLTLMSSGYGARCP